MNINITILNESTEFYCEAIYTRLEDADALPDVAKARERVTRVIGECKKLMPKGTFKARMEYTIGNSFFTEDISP